MQEQHPGIKKRKNDLNLQLKAIRIHPPHENQFVAGGKYDVFVELSREPNVFERLLVGKVISGSRNFGNTLEFTQTTVEAVSAKTAAISEGLAEVEKLGVEAAEAHEVENRRLKEKAEKEAAELERVRRIAAETNF